MSDMSSLRFDAVSAFASGTVERHRAPVALAAAVAEAATALDGNPSKRDLELHLRNIRDMVGGLDSVGVPVSAAAKALRVSEPTVRAWIARGVLDVVPGRTPVLVRSGSLGEALAVVGELRELGEDGRLLERVLHTLSDRQTLDDLSPRLGAREDHPEVIATDELLDELLGS